MGVSNLAEGGDSLSKLRLHLRERLGFADGLLEFLLGEFKPLLQLPVLLLRLIEKEKHIRRLLCSLLKSSPITFLYQAKGARLQSLYLSR